MANEEHIFITGSVAKEYGLTVRQETYCVFYLGHKNSEVRFNKTRSYQEAFKCSYRVANVNSTKLHNKEKIQAYILRLFYVRRLSIGYGNLKNNLNNIQWLDNIYMDNSYHYDKEYQPF